MPTYKGYELWAGPTTERIKFKEYMIETMESRGTILFCRKHDDVWSISNEPTWNWANYDYAQLPHDLDKWIEARDKPRVGDVWSRVAFDGTRTDFTVRRVDGALRLRCGVDTWSSNSLFGHGTTEGAFELVSRGPVGAVHREDAAAKEKPRLGDVFRFIGDGSYHGTEYTVSGGGNTFILIRNGNEKWSSYSLFGSGDDVEQFELVSRLPLPENEAIEARNDPRLGDVFRFNPPTGGAYAGDEYTVVAKVSSALQLVNVKSGGSWSTVLFGAEAPEHFTLLERAPHPEDSEAKAHPRVGDVFRFVGASTQFHRCLLEVRPTVGGSFVLRFVGEVSQVWSFQSLFGGRPPREFELVSRGAAAKRRWYTPAEFEAFALATPIMLIQTDDGTTVGTARPFTDHSCYEIDIDDNAYDSIHNSTFDRFQGWKYKTATQDWQPLGVLDG